MSGAESITSGVEVVTPMDPTPKLHGRLSFRQIRMSLMRVGSLLAARERRRNRLLSVWQVRGAALWHMLCRRNFVLAAETTPLSAEGVAWILTVYSLTWSKACRVRRRGCALPDLCAEVVLWLFRA